MHPHGVSAPLILFFGFRHAESCACAAFHGKIRLFYALTKRAIRPIAAANISHLQTRACEPFLTGFGAVRSEGKGHP
jgi:hypothetical protein